MEFAEVVRRRRMIRNYDPDRSVPDIIVHRLLDYAVHAPSAGFSQGWHFLALTAAEDRAGFWAATAEGEADNWLRGMQSAPALVLCLSDKDAYLDRYAEPDKGWSDRAESNWPVPYWDIDTGMAALLILLGAVDEGLAGCLFGVPAERHDAVHTAFDIPPQLRIVAVLSLGYRAPDQRSPSLRRGRREVAAVASRGRYGRPWPDGSD